MPSLPRLGLEPVCFQIRRSFEATIGVTVAGKGCANFGATLEQAKDGQFLVSATVATTWIRLASAS